MDRKWVNSQILYFVQSQTQYKQSIGSLEQHINLRSHWMLTAFKCQFQTSPTECRACCIWTSESRVASRNYAFRALYISTNKRKQLGQGGAGGGKPSTRCIANLATDANEDRWLVPVGACGVTPGDGHRGHCHHTDTPVSGWWMVKRRQTNWMLNSYHAVHLYGAAGFSFRLLSKDVQVLNHDVRDRVDSWVAQRQMQIFWSAKCQVKGPILCKIY